MDRATRLPSTLVLTVLLAVGCGDDGSGDDDGNATTDGGTATSTSSGSDGETDGGVTSGATDDGVDDGTSGDDGPDPTTGSDGSDDSDGSSGGAGFDCDYEIGRNGVLMFEAESLPLVEDWVETADVGGYFGDGYIYWSGNSFNNSPGNGLMEVELGIPAAGRYRVQWHTRIGMGDNPTEHNDIWLRFPNATDYYGKTGSDPESRRYPRPICEDDGFISMIEAMPQVGEVRCAEGSTSDGWMKVYSSGATEWRWSTRTSDNDAHDIFVEFDSPGAYTMQLSARADWMLLDRVVVHQEDVSDDVARAEGQAETPCD